MSNEERNQAAELDDRAGAIEDELHVAGQRSFLAFRFHPAAQPGDLLPPPTPASRHAPCPGKAEGEKEPEAYPLRYVENSFDLRTKPGAMLCDQ